MGRRSGPLNKVKKLRDSTGEFSFITIGTVVDTNDPQQMGRVRVACPLLGDLEDEPTKNIPWATYVSPLAGTATSPARGRGNDKTPGHVAYGMFNIPKVGSSVLVTCIDADPRFRVWLGCLHDQYLPHTLPHGRYSYKAANKPEGPFSSSEDLIQPLYNSQTEAFTNPDAGVDPRMSFEFRTRAADVSVAGLGDEFVNTKDSAISHLSDDVNKVYEPNPKGGDYANTQGYPKSRIDPTQKSSNTNDELYDPQTYSWTTPGFHSMSMSDSAENCRVRFRTTHGHQVIMDDTNERIYISTAGGKTWIEMDEVGNIDIYGERSISVHAGKDINYSADGDFNVNAANINLSAEEDVKVHAKGGTGVTIKATEDVFISGTELNLTSDIDLLLKSGAAINFLATGNILNTAAEVHLNGPPAAEAALGDDAAGVSRKPDHEPWARTMLVDGEPEFPYDDDNVGRVENGEDLGRNAKWHR